MGIAASAAITVVAVAIQASATHEAAFLVGRILLGVAITVNGTAAPAWVMEMAPPNQRGLLGGIYMAVWYFAAIIVSCISLGTYQYNSTWAWRGLAVVRSPTPVQRLGLADVFPGASCPITAESVSSVLDAREPSVASFSRSGPRGLGAVGSSARQRGYQQSTGSG